MAIDVLPVYARDASTSATEGELGTFDERGRLASPGGPAEPSAHLEVSSAEPLARNLEELIAALDRRVPRVEQAGEAAIARDAAVLRAKAVHRLAALASTRAKPEVA